VIIIKYSGDNVEDEIVKLVACIGKMRNAYGIFVEKSEGRRPLGRCVYMRDYY
jgi:hypothetical protein